MAKTVSQAFSGFKSALEITGLQSSTVSARHSAVRKAVADNLEVLEDFLTGSYARQTMIAPLKEADIDVFVVLANKYYYQYNNGSGGQAGLLDMLRRVLRKSYPTTPDISRNGQAVTIRFGDFLVDVVPGFHRSDGVYLIPNSISQSWISTDPKKHVQLMSESNQAHGGDLVPQIKMIKAWNRNISHHFRSFHLEALALQIFGGVTISNYWSGSRYFFDKGRELVSKKNRDPAGYSEDVGFYINTSEKVNQAVSRFETAYDRAVRAEVADRAGKSEEAIQVWRQVFGDYFPAYG